MQGPVIPIFPPSTTDILVLIVNGEVKVRDPLSESDAGENTRQASPDHNDLDTPIVIDTVLPQGRKTVNVARAIEAVSGAVC